MDRDSFVSMDMDAPMAGSGDASGRGSHEEKFRVYNDALYHAAACQEAQCQAHNGRCHKVKASIDHFVRCYGPRRKVSPIERCSMLAGDVCALSCRAVPNCLAVLFSFRFL